VGGGAGSEGAGCSGGGVGWAVGAAVRSRSRFTSLRASIVAFVLTMAMPRVSPVGNSTARSQSFAILARTTRPLSVLTVNWLIFPL